MPNVQCSHTGCTYATGDNETTIVVELLKIHALTHAAPTTAPAADAGRQKPPKLNRPGITKGLSEEEWNIVSKKWEIFKNSTNIPVAQLSTQLWQCCDEDLTSELFRDVPDISTIAEVDLLARIKQLAVLSVAACVRKTELFSLRQDRGQPIHSFAANVKGKAHTCAFSKKCSTATCLSEVDYTDDIVKHVLLAGIADEDIKRDVLGLPDLDLKSLNDTIAIIESKEMAARAMSSPGVPPGASSIAAAHGGPKKPGSDALRSKLAQRTTCKKCNISMPKFVQLRQKSGPPKLREFDVCKECWKQDKKDSKDSHDTTGAIFDQLSGIHLNEDDQPDGRDNMAPVASAENLIHHCDEL